MAIWGPIIGGAIGLYGARKSSQAAKQAANTQNEATESQYQYDMQAWEMQKQAAIADREFAVQEIQAKAEQEGQIAAYKDATNLRTYNYNLQIRNMEQDTNERMYEKSDNIYLGQTTMNRLEEQASLNDEQRKLKEIRAENLYEQNDEYLDYLIAEGEIRSRGQSGRSVDKARSTKMLEFGTKLNLLDLALNNATAESESTVNQISRGRIVADLNAYASKMLDPGILPTPVQPLPTPQAVYQYPRVFEDYDFGPQPIRGAMASPSAAATRVWGTSLMSLASTATDIINAF
tara:strand:- start:997 stop:1866 length:870 start_codon:yes stop_codon:yes gene_type:complete